MAAWCEPGIRNPMNPEYSKTKQPESGDDPMAQAVSFSFRVLVAPETG